MIIAFFFFFFEVEEKEIQDEVGAQARKKESQVVKLQVKFQPTVTWATV